MPKSQGGRPTKFKPEFTEQAVKLAALGATDREVADFFEVDERTINRWKQTNEGFCQSLNVGKEAADQRVVQSLYRRAVGYSYDAVKIFMPAGALSPVYAPFVEHVPPDTTAAIFWLKNRDKENWRDKQEVEHSGGLTFRRIERRIVDPHDRDAEGVPTASGAQPV